jgi:hypothetical protein
LLFNLTKPLLLPALTDPNPHPKDPIDDTLLLPQVRNDFGPAAFFDKGPLWKGERAGCQRGRLVESPAPVLFR